MTSPPAGGEVTTCHDSVAAGRFEFERCLLGRCKCGATPGPPQPARGVGLVLATYADGDGIVPNEFAPSLTTLARAAGFARSTVAVALNQLEVGGWITRVRPTVALARATKARTTYRLTVPSPPHGLVREPDQTYRPASPGAGLNQALQPWPAAAAADREEESAVNDHAATQLARVAAVLEVSDADAVGTVTNWAAHRDKIGRPIGSTTAVLARMQDHDIRTDLRRHVPKATPAELPSCCRESAGWILDETTRKPIAKCQHGRAAS